MQASSNLQLVSIFVILSIGWFSFSIALMKKPLKIKLIMGTLLSMAVFAVYSLLLKNFSLLMLFMFILASFVLISLKHFLDNYGETYGKMDIRSFF